MSEAVERPQQAFTQSMWGEYFVRYEDGHDSACMPRSTAESYAQMFGGTVHRHPWYDTPEARREARNEVLGQGLGWLIIGAVITLIMWSCSP